MSSVAKRKISVTVDADLIAEIEAGGENLSARVNDALRNEVATRRRQQALADFLNHLDKTEGPLDTAEDEAEIQRFMRLLGGSSS
jgi:antitoxin CcdA